GGFHQRPHALGYGLVIARIGDVVARGGTGHVSGELQIEHEPLADAPLPLENADAGLDLKRLDQYSIHTCLPSQGGVSSSSGQRARTRLSPGRSPAASRRQPAWAIMAPLSVHRFGAGNIARAPRDPAIPCNASRRRRLAATPP